MTGVFIVFQFQCSMNCNAWAYNFDKTHVKDSQQQKKTNTSRGQNRLNFTSSVTALQNLQIGQTPRPIPYEMQMRKMQNLRNKLIIAN